MAVANMRPGPLISVAAEIAERVRPGGLLLLTGFRQPDASAVRAAFERWFEIDEAPAMRREGWLALRGRRRAVGVDVAALSDAAVE